MAIEIRQLVEPPRSDGNPTPFTVPPTQAGSTIVVMVSAVDNFRVVALSADGVEFILAGVQAEGGVSDRLAGIAYALDVPAGVTEITVDKSGGSNTRAFVKYFELSPCDLFDVGTYSQPTGTVSPWSHMDPEGPGLSGPADCFAASCSRYSAGPSSPTSPGYTILNGSGNTNFTFLYGLFPEGRTADYQIVSGGGSNRGPNATGVLFAESGPSPGEPVLVPVFTGRSTTSGLAPDVAVGGSISVTADLGVSHSVGLAPTPNVGVGVSVEAGLGSSSTQGLAPDVLAGGSVGVVAGLGRSSTSGLAPSPRTGESVVAEPGTGRSTTRGLVPTVLVGGNVVVAAGLGVSSTSGLAPTTRVGTKVSTQTGRSTTSGLIPTVSVGGSVLVTAQTGRSTTRGLAPTVDVPSKLPPGSSIAMNVGAGIVTLRI